MHIDDIVVFSNASEPCGEVLFEQEANDD